MGSSHSTELVRSYSNKWQAETDAKRVKGVLAVANDIEGTVAGSESATGTRTSPAISLPHSRMSCHVFEQIKAIVQDGRVTWKVRWMKLHESEP